ncbi:MAG TPA: hypothetical protein VFB06_11550 [Streptosporangiaceae bacterium]|nr:hypothetical protein [Streptosporangiaceae bacterium]
MPLSSPERQDVSPASVLRYVFLATHAEPVTLAAEYAHQMSGGGYHVWNTEAKDCSEEVQG